MLLHVNCDEGVRYEDLDFGEGVHFGVLLALDAGIRTSNKNVFISLSNVMDLCYHCKQQSTINFSVAPLVIEESRPKVKCIPERDWFDYEDSVKIRYPKSTFFRWRNRRSK
jgi:hypothetical protein